jgi:hypothetical protein
MAGTVQSFGSICQISFTQRGQFCGRAPEHILIFKRVLAPKPATAYVRPLAPMRKKLERNEEIRSFYFFDIH